MGTLMGGLETKTEKWWIAQREAIHGGETEVVGETFSDMLVLDWRDIDDDHIALLCKAEGKWFVMLSVDLDAPGVQTEVWREDGFYYTARRWDGGW